MKNRLIAALLIVSLTGCSTLPRTAPQAATPATVATEQKTDEHRASEGVPADSGPENTTPNKGVVMAILVVLIAALAYVAVKGLSHSIANNCCYK